MRKLFLFIAPLVLTACETAREMLAGFCFNVSYDSEYITTLFLPEL